MTGPGGLPPPQHQPRGAGQPMGQGPNQQQHPSMPLPQHAPSSAAALPPERQLSRSELSGDGVSPSSSSVVSRKNSSEDNKENSHSSGGSRGDRAGSIESTTATGVVNVSNLLQSRGLRFQFFRFRFPFRDCLVLELGSDSGSRPYYILNTIPIPGPRPDSS